MLGLGPIEFLFIFVVVLILFGPKALPGIAKGLGEAVKTIKKEMDAAEGDRKGQELQESDEKDS